MDSIALHFHACDPYDSSIFKLKRKTRTFGRWSSHHLNLVISPPFISTLPLKSNFKKVAFSKVISIVIFRDI